MCSTEEGCSLGPGRPPQIQTWLCHLAASEFAEHEELLIIVSVKSK